MAGQRKGRFLSAAGAAALALLTVGSSSNAFALGEEHFGNAPRVEQPDWAPGLLDVVNMESRVYLKWVNGNENFFYRGTVEALGEALKKFAAVQAEVKEVVVRPGPGETRTFDGRPVACDWQLHVPSGIYLHMARREQGSRAYFRHATFTVFVHDRGIALDKIRIPAGVTMIGLPELVERYVKGLQNADAQVRGHAAYLLGSTAPCADGAVGPLAERLADTSEYVQRSAAGALGYLGSTAVRALGALRKGLEDKNENVRKACQEAIAKIEGAAAAPAKQDRELCERIREFQQAHAKDTKK